MVQYNTLMLLFLVTFVASALLRRFLTAINIRHLRRHGHEVPELFAGEIDSKTLTRMSRYTIESARFGSLEGLCDDLITLAILLSGFLPCLIGHILRWKAPFVVSGLLRGTGFDQLHPGTSVHLLSDLCYRKKVWLQHHYPWIVDP